MALSDLEVFNEWTYSAATEVLRQQIDLFNEATRGAVILQSTAHTGDFSDRAFYALIADLVRRRNVYGSGSLSAKTLRHLLETSVKVAAGTDPLEMDPAWWTWIQRSPEEAGAVYGQQLAVAMMADMLNTGLLGFVAASMNETDIRFDKTGSSATYSDLLTGASRLGDRAAEMGVWVAHSKVMFDLWGTALANQERLFVFGSVAVTTDGFGRPVIMTDSPALVEDDPTIYRTLGMVPGAIVVGQNNDLFQNVDTSNGNENIGRTIQSEWTFNLGLKGYSWNKGSGGASPNDAAIGSSANWERFATSKKDLAGVLVRTQ